MTGDHRLTLRKAFKALVGTAAGKGGGSTQMREQASQSQSHSRGNQLVQFPGAEHLSHRGERSGPSLGGSNEKRLD